MAEPEPDPLDFGDGPPPLDFGHGVLGRWYVGKDGGPRVGVLYSHPMPNPPVPGRRCMGSIMFDTEEARQAVPEHFNRGSAVWQLNSLEPLDVSPSLLCTTCGHHGFIKGGRWVPA
jgi:hypothetical protein